MLQRPEDVIVAGRARDAGGDVSRECVDGQENVLRESLSRLSVAANRTPPINRDELVGFRSQCGAVSLRSRWRVGIEAAYPAR